MTNGSSLSVVCCCQEECSDDGAPEWHKKRAADMQTGPRRAAIVDKQAEYSSGKSLLNWLNLAVTESFDHSRCMMFECFLTYLTAFQCKPGLSVGFFEPSTSI